MSFAEVRQTLMDNFSSVGANSYDFVPPMVSTPAVFIFPDEPYIEPVVIGSNRVKINFRVIAAVAANDNQGALGNLETLCVNVLSAIPSGYSYSFWDKPSMDQVGPTNLLVSTMTVSVSAQLGD